MEHSEDGTDALATIFPMPYALSPLQNKRNTTNVKSIIQLISIPLNRKIRYYCR